MKIGETLPNGALILDISASIVPQVKIILAKNEGSYLPFVTWSIYHDDPHSTCNGHYFQKDQLSLAMVNFSDRVKRGY